MHKHALRGTAQTSSASGMLCAPVMHSMRSRLATHLKEQLV